MRANKSLTQIFLMPALLFVAVLFGLILALVEEGWPDALAAAAISTCLIAILWSRAASISSK